MAKLQAAIIGCGGRGNEHAKGYAATDGVEVVAVVDPLKTAADALATKYHVPHTYASYAEMFAAHKPDIVSICTWTGLHAEMIEAAAAAGVRAIHAEKPMAPTWGEAKAEHAACVAAGVQLTFCHQRRFGAQYVKARELAQSGAIGKILRLEGACDNLFDWGTHWFDMFFFYNNETPAEWLMGQIEIEGHKSVFGVPVEGSGLAYIQYANGVQGLMMTGGANGGGCDNRIVGSDGVIEVNVWKGPELRMLRATESGWETPSLAGVVPPKGDTVLSVLDAIDCLQSGARPTLSSYHALQATELIFATYESSRIGGRVKLPLTITDSPLITRLGDTISPAR
jgi:UDP-N-acetylglucosamine 3-dehydrogenase